MAEGQVRLSSASLASPSSRPRASIIPPREEEADVYESMPIMTEYKNPFQVPNGSEEGADVQKVPTYNMGTVEVQHDDPYNVLSRHNSSSSRDTDGYLPPTRVPDSERGGCCYQLGSTMKRVLILMMREWCTTLCEFIIPILFVVGSIILWVVFGTESGEAKQYYNASSPMMATTSLGLLSSLSCYNVSESPIVGLDSCASHPELDVLRCPVGKSIPAGFCYNASVAAAYASVGYLYQGTTAQPPSLDELILMQWANSDEALAGRSFAGSSALQHGGKLYFVPDTADVRDLVDYMNATSVFFPIVYGGTMSISDAENIMKDTSVSSTSSNWGIVQLNSISSSGMDIAIRVNASAIPKTSETSSTWYLGGLGEDGNELYLLSGFTTLQTLAYSFYMTKYAGAATSDIPALTYTPMPTNKYKVRTFLAFGNQLAPLILVLGFLFPVSQLTKRIVVEKELRIREAMLIMGLSEGIMYLAWALIYLVWYIIVSLIIAILLRATYLPKTNFGYTFFLFFFFSMSIVALSGCIASVFSKSRLSALLAPLIYFVLAIPLFAMQSAPPGAITGIMILSPSALSVGIGLLFSHEMGGGAQANALNDTRDNPTLLLVFVFLFVDIVVYLLLMVYFDRVIPKDWGTTKNPLFFIIDPIKWCFCRNGKCCLGAGCCCACCRCCDEDADDDHSLVDGRAENGVFEEVKDEASAAVRIVGLRKKFKRGGKTFIAVNNLYWSMKEGQISTLLGHNGAGKSTTMNVMTGMLEADGGDCIIYGKSVRHQLRAARQEIGLCPQHNILWPQLTCREHLDFYASIKGLKGDHKEQAIKRLLKGVDLEEKEHYNSKDLSGGQKRKLSVAVSFVGGSRLVFLDEPTAGMDVGARRHTWGLLKSLSKAHTILLTTHFMDEADLLGDTIAIMSKGRLQCSGSNMFLKKNLGVGFILTMSVKSHADRTRIQSLICSHVAGAEPVGSGAGEAAFRLPMNTKEKFPDLLTDVEDRGPSLGIGAYSLSATTLEEIFLQIAAGEEEEKSHEAIDANALKSAVWNVELEHSKFKLVWLQFAAMMVKRFWNAMRDRRTQFFQIVCPVVCVLLAMLLTLVSFWNYPTINLADNIYDTKVDIPVSGCDGYLDMNNFYPDSNIQTWSVLDGAAFSDKLLETYNEHSEDRWGGVYCDGTTGGAVFYNSSSYHEVAVETYNVFNARLKKITNDPTRVMRTSIEPLPQTKTEEQAKDSIYALMIAVIIMIPFSFIPSTFVGWIVKERECKARHLQNVSGLNFNIYWLSNFLFDLCCYIITMFLVIIVFAIFQRKEYIGTKNIGATIILFLMYGISGIWLAYALSFLFNNHSTAQNVVMLAMFIVGFLLVLAVSAFQLMEDTKKVGEILRWIFRIVPSYCVGEGISNLSLLPLLQVFGSDQGAWDMKTIGWPCVYMAIEVPVFMFITLFVDHPGRRQRSQRLFHDPDAKPEELSDEDVDVVKEREQVLNNPQRKKDLVSVKHLRKVYSNGKIAVRELTFGVQPGEVFGFLGTNGAGKTTTISILCQEFYPTSGRAAICGYDIVKDSSSALRCIGYCPQFDACIDLLTVEEHLNLYAGVRGITSKSTKGVVEGLLKLCELTDYRKTKSHELSGGNRRKLSVALSLIGGPRVVFLDEPSAGMDPVARRGLWTAIETVADNCAVVLTTHHLEEVEALAHRVAIMVDGALHCIGDKTHLKHKFGTGFEVTLRAADTETAAAAVHKFFDAQFPAAELLEVRAGRYTYQLPKDTKLSKVFSILEENKDAVGITDYNVAQTSIEQVFMRISEEAERKEEEEHRLKIEGQQKKKCCCSCCC